MMKKSPELEVLNLHVRIGEKEILKGVNLTVRSGEIHAVMGPNGSGKSTLAQTLMGNPSYKCKIQNAKYKIGNKNLLNLVPEERAKAGIFLAFQNPLSIPGVTVSNFLRIAYQALHNDAKLRRNTKIQNPIFAKSSLNGTSILEFNQKLQTKAKKLSLGRDLLRRGINDGFSGGEKKKLEMLQALVLEPKFAIFDEIDTGLDVDALKDVANGIKNLQKAGCGVIIITHYLRILKYVRPEFVHILINGKIVETGSYRLASKIEKEGYKSY